MASLAWGGFSNGRIPVSALGQCVMYRPLPGEPVGPYAGYMSATAARQWYVAGEHYFAATGRRITLSEGYRDIGDQNNRWAIYKRKGRPLAAYPGTSLHGWGLSADVGTEGRAWLTINGHRFGWLPTGKSFGSPEPWHFDYMGGGDITKTPGELALATGSSKPFPILIPTSNGDNMIQVIITEGLANGTVLDLAPGYMHHSGNQAEADVTRNVISNPDERHKLSWADFQRVCLGHGIDRQFFQNPADLKKLDAAPWGGLWSEERAIHVRLSRIEQKLDEKLAKK